VGGSLQNRGLKLTLLELTRKGKFIIFKCESCFEFKFIVACLGWTISRIKTAGMEF